MKICPCCHQEIKEDTYAIFGGKNKDYRGGWLDFKLFVSTIEQVKWYLNECKFDWYMVYEFPSMKEVTITE